MRDRVCPIEECAATVRFEDAVVEVTPRYRLHDLDEVDEFATCPECGSAVAGFYPEDDADDGEVELILDIDGEDEADGDGTDGDSADGGGDEADGEAVDGGEGFDAPAAGFDDPDEVLADAADGDAAEGEDEEPYEPVFDASEDE